MRTMKTSPTPNVLLYCRPGFEADCAQEAQQHARQQRPLTANQPALHSDAGYVLLTLNGQSLHYAQLVFARQLLQVHADIDNLPDRDRLTPIVEAILAHAPDWCDLWLEVPDTNDGKELSAFTRRFQPLLLQALQERGCVPKADARQRLHLFFPQRNRVMLASSELYNSASAPMGILRQSMPAEAPSRSTLKLAEAFELFLSKSEQSRLLRPGMRAVDLGAAPGGWTWQLVKRGLRVTAVDNGPMKGVLHRHPLVEHLRVDGFKYAPPRPVDWLVCDMVEKPGKVAELMARWLAAGWTRQCIFNLKLPMKQRLRALDDALAQIRRLLDAEDVSYQLQVKQLYHDREEITVFLARSKRG